MPILPYMYCEGVNSSRKSRLYSNVMVLFTQFAASHYSFGTVNLFFDLSAQYPHLAQEHYTTVCAYVDDTNMM
jgi:hypothetical protein